MADAQKIAQRMGKEWAYALDLAGECEEDCPTCREMAEFGVLDLVDGVWFKNTLGKGVESILKGETP